MPCLSRSAPRRGYHDAQTRKIGPADRLVIFSDQHKGARDGADDFQRCEGGYNAALAYDDKLRFHLVELGDVEELWENTFEEVVENQHRWRRARARHR